MAILTSADYKILRQQLYQASAAKVDLKALPNLPNEAQLLAAFQAIEDFWSQNAATLKASIETALGRTITNALAKKIGLTWLMFKVGKGG